MNITIYEELKQYILKHYQGPEDAVLSSAQALYGNAAAPLPKAKKTIFSVFSRRSEKKPAQAAPKPEEERDDSAPEGSAPPCGAAAYNESLYYDALPMELYSQSTADYAPLPGGAMSDLEERLKYLDESFSEMLLRKIDEAGITDAECYKRAQLTRGHFNKIKNLKGYRAGKSTVLALVLALRLERGEAAEMLAKAGYAFSPSSKRDLIVEFCIEKGIYDIMQVNEYLLAFDQELIGTV